MKLSRREQVLVSLLLVGILWLVGIYRVILPERELRAKQGAQLQELRRQQAEQSSIIEAYRHSSQPADSSVPGNQPEFFYQNLDDIEVDHLLQELSRQTGVELLSMKSTHVPAKLTVDRINESMLADAWPEADMDTGAAIPGTAAYARTIELSVHGTEVAVMEFVQAIGEMERSVFVTLLSLTKDLDSEAMAGTVTVVFYSLEQ